MNIRQPHDFLKPHRTAQGLHVKPSFSLLQLSGVLHLPGVPHLHGKQALRIRRTNAATISSVVLVLAVLAACRSQTRSLFPCSLQGFENERESASSLTFGYVVICC